MAKEQRSVGFVRCLEWVVRFERLTDMTTAFSKRWRFPVLGILVSVIWWGSFAHSRAATPGQEIFEDQCAACHTIGKGRLVGPDLAGVTARREESWLQRQIDDPEGLIEENDPIALQLLKESDDMPMMSLDLSDAEITAVIGYLKSTEKQAVVTIGLPSQHIPTVLIGFEVVVALTLIGLKVGTKKLDVS